MVDRRKLYILLGETPTLSSDFIISGISGDLLTSLSKEEKEDLKTWIHNIEDNLHNIQRLKFSKLEEKGKELTGEDLIHATQLGFHYIS